MDAPRAKLEQDLHLQEQVAVVELNFRVVMAAHLGAEGNPELQVRLVMAAMVGFTHRLQAAVAAAATSVAAAAAAIIAVLVPMAAAAAAAVRVFTQLAARVLKDSKQAMDKWSLPTLQVLRW